MDMEKILAGLNDEQAAAVKHTEGPLLVLAGAGSGKTRVLTSRIAYLLSNGVKPWQILAITFTNKAAQEMRSRVEKLAGASAKDVWLFTFHALCARILRMEIDKLEGYDRNFVIYDTADSLNVLKNCLKELNLDDKQFPAKGMVVAISNAKNQLLDAKRFREAAAGFYEGKVAEVYQMYEQKLKGNNALDFDDLLLLAVQLFSTQPEVLARYQNRFSYVLIDEYQDTNRPQYLLARMLSDRTRNLCVVGDVDQSIYAWRGADIRNILDFEKDYPEAVTIKLECNYRSTRNILDAANAVIENNQERKPKSLWTHNEAGQSIAYYHAADERDEGRYVVENMEKLRRDGDKYGGMAVLYRTNTQSRIFEEMLIKAGIPYIMVGGQKFYERKEIKDIIAYLRVIFNGSDEVSLMRIVNVPRRGLGDATLAKLRTAARERSLPLFTVMKDAATVAGLSARFQGKLADLVTLIERLRAASLDMELPAFIEKVMKDSGYIEELEAERSVQADGRIDNLYELLSVAQEFSRGEEGTLEGFLNHIALISDIDEAKDAEDAVTLMTLHSAKGLEYPIVFLVGLEEGIFPHARTLMNDTEIEEERRLCYVGITRARERLFLTSTSMRTIYGNTVMYPPSRFLQEIPRALIDTHKRALPVYAPAPAPKTAPERPRSNQFFSPPVKPAVKAGSISLATGDKVQHPKWGVGTVVSALPKGDFQEVSIAFPAEGVKQLSTQYAPLEKI